MTDEKASSTLSTLSTLSTTSSSSARSASSAKHSSAVVSLWHRPTLLAAVVVLALLVRITSHDGLVDLFPVSDQKSNSHRSSLASWALQTPSLSTPLSSWSRVSEGVWRLQHDIDPYATNAVHHPPLLLLAFQPLLALSSSQLPSILAFALLDVFVAFVLGSIYALVYSSERYAPPLDHVPSLYRKLASQLPFLIFCCYLLHPWIFGSNLARSTTVVQTACWLSALWLALRGGREILAGMCLGLACYVDLFPLYLLPALALMGNGRKTILSCLITLAVLISASLFLFGSSWVRACYFVVATMDGELRPNTGLVWYLFTEMFDHFLPFFRFFIHVHLLLYPVPLFVKLQHRPLFLCWMLYALLAVFHPFTTLSSTAVLLLLLPLFLDLFPGIQFKFIIVNALIYISCLAPILWNMWIYQGGGNANFYFALTIAHAITQAVIITSSLSTEITHHYRRKHNLPIE